MRLDSDVCSTPRCQGYPALRHVGRLLCSSCWEAQCRMDEQRIEQRKNGESTESSRNTPTTSSGDSPRVDPQYPTPVTGRNEATC